MTTFYCKDSPELQIGGEGANREDWVVFRHGFAEVALDDPKRDTKLDWIERTTSAYGIANLGEDSDQVPEGEGETCDVCGRTFKTPLALRGHLRSHKPKA